MKKKYWKLLGLIAIIFCMALCLNVVVFTEHSMQVKCVCGVVAGVLYLSVHVIPYWMYRRRGDKESVWKWLDVNKNEEDSYDR